MTHTAEIARQSQRLLALRRANLIRRARAQLKQRIVVGDLSAAEVILEPPTEARRWPLVELLSSQPGWGSSTCRQFLAHNDINEIKPIGELTQRPHPAPTKAARFATQPHPARPARSLKSRHG